MKKTHCVQNSCWLKVKTFVGNENRSQGALKINVMMKFALKEKVLILCYFSLRSGGGRGMRQILPPPPDNNFSYCPLSDIPETGLIYTTYMQMASLILLHVLWYASISHIHF